MVFGSNVVEIVIRAKDEFSQSIDAANKSFDNLQKNLGKAVLGAGLVAFGTVGAQALGNMAAEAAKFESVMFGVNAKTKDADKLLKKLQKATSGTINKLQLMTSASTALQLGLEEEALPAMAKFATQVGPALGETAEFMFDSIVRGVGRASPLILDNLGLVIDTTKEYEEWAKANGTVVSALDKTTKLQIIQNAVVKEANERGIELNGILDTSGGKLQAFTTSIDDARLAIGEGLLPVLQPLIEGLTFVINKFNELPDPAKQAIAIISGVTVAVTLLTGVVILTTVAIVALEVAMFPFFVTLGLIIGVISLVILAFLNWKKIAFELFKVMTVVVNGLKVALVGLKNVAIIVWNKIIDTFESGVNTIINFMNFLIRQARRIPGAERLFPGLKEIENVSFSGIKGEVTDLGKLFKDLRSEAMFRVNELEAELGLNEEITKEVDKQVNATQKLTKEQELINQLQGFKVLPTTGDVFNPKAFQKSEFDTKFGYEQAKRGAGIEINIENVSGLDPDEVAEALQRILDTKIST